MTSVIILWEDCEAHTITYNHIEVLKDLEALMIWENWLQVSYKDHRHISKYDLQKWLRFQEEL